MGKKLYAIVEYNEEQDVVPVEHLDTLEPVRDKKLVRLFHPKTFEWVMTLTFFYE